MYTLTNKQTMDSVAGARVETAISLAISEADKLAEKSNANMTVVRTINHGICVWTEYKVRVAKSEIVEIIYTTDDGFAYQDAA